MKANISGIEVSGTVEEILKFKTLLEFEAEQKKKSSVCLVVTYPTGFIPSSSDASEFAKHLKNELHKLSYGNQYN